ncbi:MAG TPA: ATP synthase F1 subunit epsilon [Cytophagales bacterium]|nr:ATP synthase F1 subunit epsilon [Cytophagales bacterium]
MYLEIITPDKKVYDGDVTSVKVPGAMGSFEILNNHAPIVSALDKGEVRVKTANGQVLQYQVDGGVVEVFKNRISLLIEVLL